MKVNHITISDLIQNLKKHKGLVYAKVRINADSHVFAKVVKSDIIALLSAMHVQDSPAYFFVNESGLYIDQSYMPTGF